MFNFNVNFDMMEYFAEKTKKKFKTFFIEFSKRKKENGIFIISEWDVKQTDNKQKPLLLTYGS